MKKVGIMKKVEIEVICGFEVVGFGALKALRRYLFVFVFPSFGIFGR